MDAKENILIFDSQNNIHQLMDEVLLDYKLSYLESVDDALKCIDKKDFELQIVAIGEGDEHIYQKIEQLKVDQGCSMPVIYLSCSGIDLNNKGLEYCRVDSIVEPYGVKVFLSMVQHSIEDFKEKQNHKSEVAEVAQAMLALQTDNAKLYDISRFLQHSFFCQDIAALCEQLFVVTRSFNTSCTIYIHSDKNNFFISDGIKRGEKINNDILTMLKDESRIYQFGNDRAVFNWGCASLLVNKLGSEVDNLALLMDGFEMGFRTIESADDFNLVLDKYRKQNYELKIQVAKVVEGVAANITDELGQLGATAMLTVEQEDSLVEIAEQGRAEVDKLFDEGIELDSELSQIMTKMRTQSESKPDSEADSSGDNDSIDFF